jgi:hypothetical protein
MAAASGIKSKGLFTTLQAGHWQLIPLHRGHFGELLNYPVLGFQFVFAAATLVQVTI